MRKQNFCSSGKMNLTRGKCLFLLVLIFFFNHQWARSQEENKLLTGVVTNSKGEPLSGVSVLLKGTGQGTVSNEKGTFRLSVPHQSAQLVFSAVGYLTQEITVGSQDLLRVMMETEGKELDNVVVVGYGSQTKRRVTGAITKIDMKKTENLPNTSVTQSMRGRVAGVQFTDNGRPGQNGTILIRGPRSLSAGNNPLIVLDGIIFNGSLSDINPNDILSMEVLKDASASAIYGSRAANGVILISSKKGTTEKPTIRFNAFYGRSDYGYKIKLLSPERYIQKTLDVRKEAGLEADPDKVADYLAPNEAENYLAGKTIEPWEAASQQGKMSSYDLSISGRTPKSNYYISGSMTDEKGLILNDNQKRLSLRTNFENKITDWLTMGLQATYVNRDYTGVEANIAALMQSSPYATWYREDGSPTEFVVDGENVAGNPIRDAYLRRNETIQNNLFSNFYADVKIPFLKGLSYRLNYSPNIRWSHDYSFRMQDKYLTNNITTARKYNRNDFDWVLENILNYKTQLGRDHSIDATLLYGRNHLQFESTTANASRLSTDALGWNSLELGETLTNASLGQKTDGVSYMFRLNYGLLNRYLFTVTARTDGSSVFSKNNKYATFPSAAIAWLASEEPFLNQVPFLDLLKLRLSYGAVGNQAISPYQSLSLLETTQYVFGDGGPTSLGVYPANMANSDLKWETTFTSNLGLDFELFDRRVGGTIEYYDMKTKDLIIRRALPRMTGFTNVLTNLGETNNRGIEITLNTVNIRKNKFEWSTDFTFSRNKNRIVHLYQSDTDGDGKEDDDLGNRWFIGQPITVYYDYVFDGIYQQGDALPAGYKPGYTRLKDLNKDGIINADDRTVIGQGAQPKYRWGLGNNFKYGNLSLSVFLNAMQGWISNFGLIGRGPADRSLNVIDAGWWTPENKSNTRPSLLHENKYGHNYYISRDFVRIQDVSLAYEVPGHLLEKIKISSLRFFASGKNLKTFTDWIGADPESGAVDREDMFPMPRTFSVGLNLGF